MCWLKYVLRKTEKWKIFLEHTKNLEKRENGNGRIIFSEKFVENDVIPDFLKLSVPKKDVFSDQAVRGFQLRLLKTEQNKARENKANLDARSDSSRSELCQALQNCSNLWPSKYAYISGKLAWKIILFWMQSWKSCLYVKTGL